jgi:putative tryptophan/tyrosine transport system substrate-binding protein
MRRREFISLISATVVSISRPAYAQTKSQMPIVGFLLIQNLETAAAKQRIESLRKGLQEEGFVEGKNYSLIVRSAEADVGRFPQLAKQLGDLTARVIVVMGSLYGMDEFRRSFPELPIVCTAIAVDLVERGLVQSYVHPGGMLTGNVMNAGGGEETMTQKRIGLFKELVPDLRSIGMITTSNGSLAKSEKDALQKVAASLGFEFKQYGVNSIDDLDSAFSAGLRDGVSAFYISGEPQLVANMAAVARLAAAAGKPTVGPIPDWTRAGLLMSYSTDPMDGVRHAGIYAGKILQGAKPGDLPIVQASKFIFTINLKTAKALGIAVPEKLLALADELID